MLQKIKYFVVINLCLLGIFLVGCASQKSQDSNSGEAALADGTYTVNISLEGGSGRASVTTPSELRVENGKMIAVVEWSSSHYDYMKIGEEKYLPVNTEGNSVFEIPVDELEKPMTVIADTTAMSTAHEIEYQMTFSMEDNGDDMEEEMEEGNGASGQGNSLTEALDPKSISKELIYDHSMELKYATEFMVDYYDKGYALIQIDGDGAYLLLPEGQEAPSDLSDDITILQAPVKNIYLVASAVMDMYRSIGALDQIRFTGTKQENWYLDEVAEAMKKEEILYAGKYSAPDYEKIMAEKCGLAIENTMIYHTPSVKEQLERFGIPVMVDHSSYEKEPLGRTEWVKLYGLLAGKEEEANAAFEAQIAEFAQITPGDEGEKTVAFFYFTNDGQVNVRRTSDYLPKMIEMAGGKYIFDHLGEEEDNASSTMSMQMEEFYATVKDADYMIYNATTVGEVESINDLLEKNALLSKCKAVENKQVFCTSKNLYQSSMELGTIIGDFHKMLHGEQDGFTYLYRLE